MRKPFSIAVLILGLSLTAPGIAGDGDAQTGANQAMDWNKLADAHYAKELKDLKKQQEDLQKKVDEKGGCEKAEKECKQIDELKNRQKIVERDRAANKAAQAGNQQRGDAARSTDKAQSAQSGSGGGGEGKGKGGAPMMPPASPSKGDDQQQSKDDSSNKSQDTAQDAKMKELQDQLADLSKKDSSQSNSNTQQASSDSATKSIEDQYKALLDQGSSSDTKTPSQVVDLQQAATSDPEADALWAKVEELRKQNPEPSTDEAKVETKTRTEVAGSRLPASTGLGSTGSSSEKSIRSQLGI